jgi:hypothetical protein
MALDQKTVRKLKDADKLKRNAITKDQMVSALNKINYLRKIDEKSPLRKDSKLPNLKVPKKGPAGTTKYSRFKTMDKIKKESPEIDESKKSQEEDDGVEHIIMQLRKSVSLRGQKDIQFGDGKKKKVSFNDAQAALTKYNRSNPSDKIKLQKQYEKGYNSFSQAIK